MTGGHLESCLSYNFLQCMPCLLLHLWLKALNDTRLVPWSISINWPLSKIGSPIAMRESTIVRILKTQFEIDRFSFFVIFNSDMSWWTLVFISALKCLLMWSQTSHTFFHERTRGKIDYEIVKGIHVKRAWSWTIQDLYSFDLMFVTRSSFDLNIRGIRGFTTNLWSSWERITPSICWFQRRKLFS